jgi:hypothetical protein
VVRTASDASSPSISRRLRLGQKLRLQQAPGYFLVAVDNRQFSPALVISICQAFQEVIEHVLSHFRKELNAARQFVLLLASQAAHAVSYSAPRDTAAIAVTNPVKFDRILIRATNWVGDAVMALPAVEQIRARFPQAHLAVLAHPRVAGLYRKLSSVDEVIPYSAPRRSTDAIGTEDGRRPGNCAGDNSMRRFCCKMHLRPLHWFGSPAFLSALDMTVRGAAFCCHMPSPFQSRGIYPFISATTIWNFFGEPDSSRRFRISLLSGYLEFRACAKPARNA